MLWKNTDNFIFVVISSNILFQVVYSIYYIQNLLDSFLASMFTGCQFLYISYFIPVSFLFSAQSI